VTTKQGKHVIADYVILATHFPCYDGRGFYFARMYPERSYVIALKVKEKFLGGMYITAEDPGRSLRSQEHEGGELLIVGGEHHKTAHGTRLTSHYENLLEFAREHYDVQGICCRWSTQDYTTLDKVPYTGRLTSKIPNVFVATGFRKWGMTNSTASAMIITDLITKGENPWAEVYDPSRFIPNPSITSFISINSDVAAQLAKGKLKPAEQGIEIEKDTFINNVPGEEAIPHHYTDENELIRLFGDSGELKISPYRYSYVDNSGNTHYIHAFVTICRKK
jgi:hypothetical protein